MEIDEERLVSTLQSLVKIPSFKDSIDISRWVKDELQGFGYEVYSDSDGNLIAEIGKGPGFLLNAHLDTVGPGEGWKHDPFSGEIHDGKLYGRGASDCKAGVAAMIEIARILKRDEKKLRKRVVFTFTAFEEGYSEGENGVCRILPKLKGIDKGLSLEPSALGKTIGIAVGCRGSTFYHVEIFGKRGHSSRPHLSDNPVYKFPAFLERIKHFPRRKTMIPLTGEIVNDQITVTEIHAEEGANVVPGVCRVTLDRRSLPDEKPGEVDGKLERICRQAFGNKFRMMRENAKQGYYFDDRRFLDMCVNAVESLGLKAKPYFQQARIDSSLLYNLGNIGSFMLGPGSMNLAHQIDEHCEIEGMFRATEAVLEVIRRWDKG
ncbi:MAG: M20/M25/M40 family metallo-hydrolase [Candidatus Aenigmarchaeota archaeon]|nr:M20/M25/M40 family metallo-hydrolase [Candidatus Aenigmarchaeota archaeon]